MTGLTKYLRRVKYKKEEKKYGKKEKSEEKNKLRLLQIGQKNKIAGEKVIKKSGFSS